jgi:hypothetical protein
VNLSDVLSVYMGSDGTATTALYASLQQLGPAGEIALNLFRAQKNSERAKVYRGGGYRGKAYDRKEWALSNLTEILGKHGEACGIRFGWGEDLAQTYHRHVLYVDLPAGQVSFHSASRGAGPDYAGKWDGDRGVSPSRICSWCAKLLEQTEAKAA